MPLEFGLWRIDGDLAAVDWGAVDLEERLESFLDRDITVAADNWMVIGRQVLTDHGGRIDLLARRGFALTPQSPRRAAGRRL